MKEVYSTSDVVGHAGMIRSKRPSTPALLDVTSPISGFGALERMSMYGSRAMAWSGSRVRDIS